MFFKCRICDLPKFQKSEVVILSCKHCFCYYCLEKYVLKNMTKNILCPSDNCDILIDNCYLKEVLSDEDILKYEVLCMEGQPGVHKCVLPECQNVIQCPENQCDYICPKCSLFNCIRCDSTHKGISCDMFKSFNCEKRNETCQNSMTKARQYLHEMTRKSLLVALQQDLFVNDKIFQCILCYHCIGKGFGVKLRTCFHNICRPCLIRYVKESQSIPVKCPSGYCDFVIEDRELNCILTKEEFNIYQRKIFNRSKYKITGGFQCQQANCDYFCVLWDKNVRKFKCPKCSSKNCIKCKAVHRGKSCEKYRKEFKKREYEIEKLIKDGKCMSCPDCHNLVSKSNGCNWIKCCQCGLELCWILKMPRWGPNGLNDISGGCKCGIDGYCHPECIGCSPDI